MVCMILDFSQCFTERTPRVVSAAKLLRPAGRKKAGRFLAEGFNSVEAAVVTGVATDVFVTEAGAQRYGEVVQAAQYMGIYVHPVTEKAAKSLSDTVTSTGLYAVCRPALWEPKDALGKDPRLVAVPVETAEPGNAGTMIRVADAVGASAVTFLGDSVDPQSPKAVRASAGSLFHVPVARERSIDAGLDRLRAKGLTIIATAADGEVDLDDAEELLARPSAWLFGNEAHGLGEDLLGRADVRVRIPIRGRAESLNLATAASICLYQAAKHLYGHQG